MNDSNPLHNDTNTGKHNLKELVRRSVLRHAMFEPEQALLVAVSGGVDSTAMLHILLDLSSDMSLRLGVAHLNHGLRGEESDADAEFVASLAEKCRLPHYSEHVDAQDYASMHGLSLEEACRRLRYRFLLMIANQHGYDRVAVGHHREDNAESVLMGLLRGSGLTGLSGMVPVRADGIIRPMIDLSREWIKAYAATHGLAFVTDRTNSDTRLLRNRIRLELMPMLASDYNPNIVETLNRTSAVLKPEDEWLSELSREMLDNALENSCRGMMTLLLSGFNELRSAARRRVLRMAIEAVKGDLRRIGLSHVADVLEMAVSGSDGAELHLPDGIRVRRRGEFLDIVNPEQLTVDTRSLYQAGEPAQFRYEIPVPGFFSIPETGDSIRLTAMTIEEVTDLVSQPPEIAYFDADCLQFPLTVRNIRSGDRFSPLGTTGSQKLKKFFCDHKIHRQRRYDCPLLLSKDRIIWVAGMRIDSGVKVTEKTTRVLKAELILA